MESQILRYYLACLIIQSISYQSLGYKFLILHPIYSGSHVLTVHQISRELITRGHDVLTIRYRDTHDLRLENPSNEDFNKNITFESKTSFSAKKKIGTFREYEKSLNNSEGHIPYVTTEEEARFVIPSELLWSKGMTLSTLFTLPKDPWKALQGCIYYKLIFILK